MYAVIWTQMVEGRQYSKDDSMDLWTFSLVGMITREDLEVQMVNTGWALRQINCMTQTGYRQLRVDMEAFDGDGAYALYN